MTTLNNKENKRANDLADRLLNGANILAKLAEELTEAEWKIPVDGDGRTIGVVIHHVASVYPIEIELAQLLANSQPITGATMDGINQMNAEHALEHKHTTKLDTIALLKKNSIAAANAVREFSNESLENSASVSLNANAPLTAQFFIEDHALRHSYHHLAKIEATIKK